MGSDDAAVLERVGRSAVDVVGIVIDSIVADNAICVSCATVFCVWRDAQKVIDGAAPSVAGGPGGGFDGERRGNEWLDILSNVSSVERQLFGRQLERRLERVRLELFKAAIMGGARRTPNMSVGTALRVHRSTSVAVGAKGKTVRSVEGGPSAGNTDAS